MPDANLRIVLTAVDKTGGALKNFKSSVSDLTKAVPGLGSAMSLLGNPITLAAAGITGIAAEMGKAIGKAEDYALSIGDLAKVWGTSVEEASKLVQVADDVRVSQEQLANSMKIAMKQGVEPTIAGLQEAAKTYQSFTNTQDRATWAAKTFGKNWTAVARLLELTPEQFNASVKSAEKFGLVIGQDDVEAAKRYHDALDNMTDAGEGLEIQLGTRLLPVAAKVVETFNEGTNAGFEIGEELGTLASLIEKKLVPNFVRLSSEELKVTSNMSAGMGDIKAYEAGLTAVDAAAEESAKSNTRVAMSITEVSKTSAAKTALDLLTQAYKDGTIAQDVYNNKTSDIMRNWLGMPSSQVTASIAMQNITQDMNSGKISALEAANAYLSVGRALNAIPRDVSVVIHTTYTESGRPVTGSQEGRRAGGGPVSGGSPYIVGERGPELFVPSQSGTIIPNVTNNFSMNVHTNAGSSTLTRDYAMMRARVR
jgi:hypothetical protein